MNALTALTAAFRRGRVAGAERIPSDPIRWMLPEDGGMSWNRLPARESIAYAGQHHP
jgi:hypothetical protein